MIMIEKATADLIRSQISVARGNLEYVLDHPSDKFDIQRIRLALDQINFALSLLDGRRAQQA